MCYEPDQEDCAAYVPVFELVGIIVLVLMIGVIAMVGA